MNRTLILIGLAIVAAGVLWPVLSKLGLGRLPGDIVVERGNARVYVPVATCLLLSVAATILLSVFRR